MNSCDRKHIRVMRAVEIINMRFAQITNLLSDDISYEINYLSSDEIFQLASTYSYPVFIKHIERTNYNFDGISSGYMVTINLHYRNAPFDCTTYESVFHSLFLELVPKQNNLVRILSFFNFLK
nr:hypothetical protein [Hepelivirales sp.]